MIRKLENRDIEAIMNIWKEATIKAHDFIDESYWINNYNVVKDVYIPMSEVFVYEKDSKIYGFIAIIENGFIGALFVDVNKQGLGIGSKLIDFALDKYKQLDLAVYKDNKSSVEFYKKKGFEIIVEQENEDSNFMEYIMRYKK
ncbi:N-acetyltransferase [[Clostridium] dakarense]|uniref:N-acetyltransferase n=1 Tax=Faecalimicrobium dakarense TaxID=1301100 RepID=UPI0004AE5D04|nr:N-acetyltransferase [[Clostridium] dakarense]